MNKYIWINITSLAFNFFVALLYYKNITKAGLPGNVAGAFFILIVIAAGIMFLHLVCIGIMYFTKNLTFSLVVTVISSVSSIVIAMLSVQTLVESTANEKRWRQEREEADRKANSPEARLHQEFLSAIYSNDSTTVRRLADQGVIATDEDLSIAVTQCFVVNVEISPEIFKTLLNHGANARTSPPYYANNQFCKNLEAVKLLLEGGADPLPDKEVFPLVCLPQLKLLLQYGAGVNTLTHVYYNYYRQSPRQTKLPSGQSGKWTPIMMYFMEYPKYFEETQFLLTQKPDIKYKDENGYTLQTLLKDVVDKRTSNGEPVKELIEFEKRIQEN